MKYQVALTLPLSTSQCTLRNKMAIADILCNLDMFCISQRIVNTKQYNFDLFYYSWLCSCIVCIHNCSYLWIRTLESWRCCRLWQVISYLYQRHFAHWIRDLFFYYVSQGRGGRGKGGFNDCLRKHTQFEIAEQEIYKYTFFFLWHIFR